LIPTHRDAPNVHTHLLIYAKNIWEGTFLTLISNMQMQELRA